MSTALAPDRDAVAPVDTRAVRAVLAAAVLAFALLQSLVTPVLGLLQHDLGSDAATTTWVITAYLVSASVCTPVLGRLSDTLGKDRVLLLALVALAAGSLLAAVAPTMGVMIAARVLQGVGGGVLPVAFGLLRELLPAADVPAAVGALAALVPLGLGVGAAAAGPVVAVLGPTGVFWVPFALVLAATAVTRRVLPHSRADRAPLPSLLPSFLLPAWLVPLLLGVAQGPERGWASSQVLLLLGGAVLLAVAWFAAETRAAAPLLDLEVMRLRAVWSTNIVSLLTGVAMYPAFVLMPQLVAPTSTSGSSGQDVTAAGLVLLPWCLAMAAAGVVTGRLVQRHGGRRVLVAGSAMTVGPLLALAVAPHPYWLPLSLGVPLGVGFGLAFSAVPAVAVTAAPPAAAGSVSGTSANIRTIGGAVGMAMTTGMLDSSTAVHPSAAGDPHTTAFVVLAATAVLAALCAVLVPASRSVPASGRGGDRPLQSLRRRRHSPAPHGLTRVEPSRS